ncbi:MAG TPA: ABC transporter permease subunit [Streptosporangiaceae bacterium]|nr:ABC transporter permease subunit [Streptosporangiaceae bacterium]
MSVVNPPFSSASQAAGSQVGAPADQAPPRTTVPWRAATRSTQRPRQIAGVRRADVLAIAGALASALATTGLLWFQLAPFTGILGYVVVSWCLFVLIYGLLVAFDNNRPTVRDRVSAVIVHSLAVVVVLALLFVILYTVFKGAKALRHLNFYTQDLHTTNAFAALTKGGILHAMIGTLIEVGIAMAIAVPLGLLAAVFLNEVPGKLNRLVRTLVDAMTALPDVLAGLFIYATLILIFGLGLSGLAAGCALAVTVVSIICRAAYVVLRLVPGGLTEASFALGSGQWRTVWHVTLPTARSGLATAVILGAARAIGETAPVLLTAGYTNFINVNPVNGPMNSLPLAAYELVSSGEGPFVIRGFGAASVLLALVLLLFGIARVIGGRGAGQLTSRQLARRMAASHRDLTRYTERAAARPPIALAGGPGADYGGASA